MYNEKLKSYNILFKEFCKKLISGILCLSVIFLFSSCDLSGNKKVQDEFDEFCEKLFIESLSDDALSAHFIISEPEKYGINFKESDYNLGEVSVQKSEEDISSMQDDMAELKEFERERLTDIQKTTYDTLKSYMEIQLSFSGCTIVSNIFSPNSGVITNLTTIFTEYVFYDKNDAKHYLLLLKDVKRFIDDCIGVAEEQSEKGYFMSDEIADKAIEECDKYYKGEGKDIIEEFEQKLKDLKFTESEKNELTQTCRKYVDDYYLPALKSAADALAGLKGTGKNNGGLCEFGNIGKRYYEALVKDKTSSSMTPDDMINMLDKQIADIIKSIGKSGTENYNAAFDYQPSFESADEILEFLIKNIQKDFPTPVTDAYKVSNMTECGENEMTNAYYMKCRIDDTSVNNIRVNSSSVGDDSLSLYQTLSHEAYPGHLYAYTGFFSNENIPDVRKILEFIGATEGWAQYASSQATYYLDASEGVKEMINLAGIFSYCLMARIDAGVNYQGWNIDKVYEYLSDYIVVDNNYEDENNSVARLYYTAVGNPGDYIPYAVGFIEMNSLREHAEEKLGKDFDKVEYHRWIVNVGVTAYNVYESELDKWIEEQSLEK